MSRVTLADINRAFEEMRIQDVFKPLIGNENIRVLCSLIFPLRSQSIVIGGEAGAGKTVMMDGIVRMVWGDEAFDGENPDVFYLTGASGKGLLNHENANKWNTARHIVVPELEYILRGAADTNEDILKTACEFKKYIYTRSILGGQDSETIELKPRPIMAALANENPRLQNLSDEMERRLNSVYMTSNTAMNKAVHVRKALIEALPDHLIYTGGGGMIADIQDHFRRAMNQPFDDYKDLDSIFIKNPCAPFVESAIPAVFTKSNTTIGQWHETMKAVTHFYWEDRQIYDDGRGNAIMLVTPGDAWTAWDLAGQSVVYSALKIKDIGRELLDMVPKKSIEDYGALFGRPQSNEIHIDLLQDKLKAAGIQRTTKQLEDMLTKMNVAGYIKTDGKGNWWKTQDLADIFEASIDWGLVCEQAADFVRKHYPKDVADDYEARYCADPTFPHWRTGETVKLLDGVEPREGGDVGIGTEDVDLSTLV